VTITQASIGVAR